MNEIVVIAHNIRSSHNVGSILRTAEGFGVSRVYLTGYTPYPKLADDVRLPHIAAKTQKAIHKTALGAEEIIPITHMESAHECISTLRSSGYTIVALEQDKSSTPLPTYTPSGRTALLLGEEVNGIEADLLQRADDIVEIPMLGKKESFNVSVAAGIAMYALSR